MGNNKGANFYDVQSDFNNYWKDKTPSRSRGYKPFKRWESYMKERVYPSGDMSLPSNTYNNFVEWQKGQNSYRQTNSILSSNWTEVGPIGSPSGPSPYSRTGAGRLTFVRFSPDLATMYVGAADGGLWKSTNDGVSWTTNTDFLAVIGCADLAISPSNPNIMYLATGDVESDRKSIGILKSTDGGNSWNPTSLTFTIPEEKKITKLLMDPTNPLKMIAATNEGVYFTTDGWVTNTFSDVNGNSPNLYDMELNPNNPNIVYAAGTGVFMSIDFGTTWNIATGIPTSDVTRIALGVSAQNPNYVYALIAKGDSTFKGVYRSTDNGSTFTTRSTTPNLLGYEIDGSDNGGQGFYDLAIAVSPTDANYLVIGGINHWISADGGTTWTNTSVWNSGEVHADVHDLYFLPGSGTTVFSCNDGGISKSINSGDQWTDISSNLAISQVVGIGLSQTNVNFIVSGHQDNGTNLKTASTWANINGGDGGECFTDYTNNDVIYVQYVQGAYSRSMNGGVDMDPITTGLPSNIDFYSPFKIDPVNPLKIYSGGTATLYKSDNQGDQWQALGTLSSTSTIKDFVICPSNPAIIYTLQSDAISKSINSGASFSNITGTLPTNTYLKSITVSNTDPNKIWVTYSGYNPTRKVYKSVDGGLTWTNISNGLPNLPINTIVYRKDSPQDEVYIGADIGVYTTSNTSSSWTSYMTGLPNVAVTDLEIYYPTNKLRAATYGRGIWENDLEVLSSNEFEFENFSLYPNPNDGNFTIKLNTSSTKNITIKVTDLRGTEVYLNSFRNNGFFNENIQLKNIQNGVYLININDGINNMTRKIIIK